MKFAKFKDEFKSLYEKDPSAMDQLLSGFVKIRKEVNKAKLTREKRIQTFNDFPIFMKEVGAQKIFKRDLLKKEVDVLSLAFISMIDKEYAETLIQYN